MTFLEQVKPSTICSRQSQSGVLHSSNYTGVGEPRMGIPAESEPRIRFAQFELDLRTRELRINGRKFILQEQPFQILAALLERPGHLVSREELRQRLWSSDTFVDFERGLNKAVNRLREVLEDSADQA